MGTWSSGAFDNDDAADWAYRLTDTADEGVVEAALRRAIDAGSPSAPVAQTAVAAAEVVAAGLGAQGPDLPTEVAAWVHARRDRPWADLARLARSALDRVTAESELAELWGEDDPTAWMTEVDGLRARLRSREPLD